MKRVMAKLIILNLRLAGPLRILVAQFWVNNRSAGNLNSSLHFSIFGPDMRVFPSILCCSFFFFLLISFFFFLFFGAFFPHAGE